jgi:hypothetical protein
MKRLGVVALVALALLLTQAVPGEAGGRFKPRGHHVRTRVFVGFGPSFYWGPPYPYPYWYYPRPYYIYAPPVVVHEPPVYIQQPAPAAPPPPPPAPPPPAYWYYCASAEGYYPDVPTCPEAWIKVPPRSD